MILEGNWIRCMTRPKFCVIPRLIFSILILWLFSRTDLEIKTETFGFLWQYRDPQKIGKILEMLHSELSRWERPFWAIREPPRRILYCLATGIYVPGCCYDVVQPVASLIECGRELWGTFIVLGGSQHIVLVGAPTSQHHHLFLLQWPTTTPAVCCLCVAQHFFGMFKNSLFSSYSPAQQEER